MSEEVKTAIETIRRFDSVHGRITSDEALQREAERHVYIMRLRPEDFAD